MASDLTPERRAFLRDTANLESGIVLVAKEELIALLGMAERCADYDRRLSEVMPKDFKDWHQNSPKEWPEVAAGTITSLRQREDWAHAQMARALEKAAAIHRVLVAARGLMQCPKCIGPCDDPTVHAELEEALRALDDKEQRT